MNQVVQSFDMQHFVRPEVIENPYPYYETLRELPPQFGLLDYPPGTVPGQDEPHPSWAVFNYEDVARAAREHDFFSSRDPMQESSEAPTLMLVNHDRPEHTLLRAIAQQAFTPKRVLEDVGPWAEKTVAEMFDRLESPEMDFMDSFAVEIPARFLTRLIGTPEEDWHLLRDWGNAFMVTADFTIEERNQHNRDLGAYYKEAVMRRYKDIEQGKQPPDDLMTGFIGAAHNDRTLSVEEVIRFCITLVVAGAETTVYFLGNLIATLIERPDLFQQLQDDRTQIRPFMEESLRRDGPIQRLFRICTQDTELGGVDIKQGDWVALFFASANRDPAVFENPDEFILNRPNIKRHMTFGHGIHFCMGNAVARMEAEKLLNGIFDRVKGIEWAEGGMKRQSGGLLNYGAESLNVRLVMK